MKAQVRLFHILINYWDPNIEAFNIDGKPLRIEAGEI
jgi:hypothetical protein